MAAVSPHADQDEFSEWKPEGVKPSRRREFCHSAASPSPFSRCFNRDGEGMSVK